MAVGVAEGVRGLGQLGPGLRLVAGPCGVEPQLQAGHPPLDRRPRRGHRRHVGAADDHQHRREAPGQPSGPPPGPLGSEPVARHEERAHHHRHRQRRGAVEAEVARPQQRHAGQPAHRRPHRRRHRRRRPDRPGRDQHQDERGHRATDRHLPVGQRQRAARHHDPRPAPRRRAGGRQQGHERRRQQVVGHLVPGRGDAGQAARDRRGHHHGPGGPPPGRPSLRPRPRGRRPAAIDAVDLRPGRAGPGWVESAPAPATGSSRSARLRSAISRFSALGRAGGGGARVRQMSLEDLRGSRAADHHRRRDRGSAVPGMLTGSLGFRSTRWTEP